MRLRLKIMPMPVAAALAPALLLLVVSAVLPGMARATDHKAADESKAQQRIAKALDAVSDRLEALEEDAHSLRQRAEALETRFALDFSRVGPSRAMYLPDAPEGKVTVQLRAEPVAAAMAGRFEFHLAAPEMNQVFQTESFARGQTAPTGQALDEGIAFVEPGKLYTLQVLYRNPTDQEVRFLVGAPTTDPQAALPFARARCWCAAIPFSAPPGGVFSRTLQVGVAPDTPPGAKAIVIWPVVALQ